MHWIFSFLVIPITICLLQESIFINKYGICTDIQRGYFKD